MHRETAILDSILAAVVIADAETHEIIHLNPVAEQILGWSETQLKGKACLRWDGLDKGTPDSLSQASIKHETTAYLFHSSGARRLVLRSSQPLLSEGRTRTVHSFMDITEFKDAENHLKQAKAEADRENQQWRTAARRAKKASAAKSRLLATLSHEIRTPLSGIMGMLDLALDEEISERLRDYLETGRTSARALLEIVDNLLDLSKIEAGKMCLDSRPCDLEDLLGDIEAILRPQLAEKHLDFGIRFETPVPRTLQTDSTRLRQCLINLASNAIKFTEKGHVHILLSCDTLDNKTVIRLAVEDTGMGIPRDRQAVIFDAFTQAHTSTARKYGGTGLGLAITTQLVTLLGGTLSLDSTVGKGSRFAIRLPVETKGPMPALRALRSRSRRHGSPKANADLPPGHILVAEDDPVSQKTIQSLLRREGLQVTLAGDGQEAVNMAISQRFDLILMDMLMPTLNGVEATETLRAHGLTTPIVALTAGVTQQDRGQALAAGCNHYLPKPICREQLRETLRHYLSGEDRSPAAKPPPAKHAEQNQDGRAVIAWNELTLRIDDESLLDRIVTHFLRDNGKRLQCLAHAIENHDSETVRSLAHAIKGSSATIAAHRLSSAAQDLERAARSGATDTFAWLYATVREAFEKVETILSDPAWHDTYQRHSHSSVPH
jgi:PAS domain S-box-containing protein